MRVAAVISEEGVEETAGIPVSTIGRTREGKPHRRVNAHRGLIQHAEKVWRLFRLIHIFRPDVVHLHGALGKLDSLYFGLARFLGARIAYTVHDMKPSRWLDAFNRLRYRAADLIIVHSSNTTTKLTDYYGVAQSRIREIPHASPLPLTQGGALSREMASAAIGLPAGARAVLFFGDIAPRKGLDLLIDAHEQLCREHSQTYLIIAGRPRSDFHVYWQRIEQRGLSGRVIADLRYVPFDRMRIYFSAADVVALPYREAYQSHVLQWAYAFGRPIVATDVGGLREAVMADGTGLIAERDSEGLARAISALLSDGRLAQEMGDRALRLAQTKYSWEAVSEMLEGSYRGLVAGDGDRGKDATHSVKSSAKGD